MNKPNKTIKYQIKRKIIREKDTESNVSGEKFSCSLKKKTKNKKKTVNPILKP